MSQMEFTNVMYLKSPVHDTALRKLTGCMINLPSVMRDARYDKIQVPPEYMGDITYDYEFHGREKPKLGLLKMSKSSYIDAFFKDGSILLGTYKKFREIEQKEIGDKSEGSTVAVSVGIVHTVVTEFTTGFNHYVFCTYDGEKDQKTIDEFGYDDYFLIKDVDGFRNSIQRALKSNRSLGYRCLYRRNKVFMGVLPDDHDLSQISHKLANIVNDGKYFVKHSTFSHQNEYRLIWEMPTDVDGPILIKCPEAIQYCQRR